MNAARTAPPGHDPVGLEFETPDEFEGHLATAARAVAGGVPHALMVVSLERAAEVARECGEDAESALLEVVRLALYIQLGDAVHVVRLPPDRIAVLKPHCLPRDAPALGKRVRTTLEGGRFLWRGRCFRLGARVGVLEMADDELPPGEQLARASDACSRAAALGGDGLVVTTGQAQQRAALEAEQAWREHLREVI